MPVKLSTDESGSKTEQGSRSTAKLESPTSDGIYTCPMHPEVQQNHPGECPKCGMTLERKTARSGTNEDENAELRDMTKRFWIGAARMPFGSE